MVSPAYFDAIGSRLLQVTVAIPTYFWIGLHRDSGASVTCAGIYLKLLETTDLQESPLKVNGTMIPNRCSRGGGRHITLDNTNGSFITVSVRRYPSMPCWCEGCGRAVVLSQPAVCLILRSCHEKCMGLCAELGESAAPWSSPLSLRTNRACIHRDDQNEENISHQHRDPQGKSSCGAAVVLCGEHICQIIISVAEDLEFCIIPGQNRSRNW